MKNINAPAYELVESRRIDDLNSESFVLRHKKTGARVALLSNDEENKVFAIGFRTPPKDSTGVAHIIEHTVLCGSEKYPIKDPFLELAKGSLNTFLNAMTFPYIRLQAVMTLISRILWMFIWMRFFIRISTRQTRFLARKAGIMKWKMTTPSLQ